MRTKFKQRHLVEDPRAALATFFRAGLNSRGRLWERRLYKRLWARVHRLDRQVRIAEAKAKRELLRDPAYRKNQAIARARWGKRNRRHLRAYNRRYHREHRARRCGFCNARAPRGRYGLRPVRGRLACTWCYA